jgi:hypothetical protein
MTSEGGQPRSSLGAPASFTKQGGLMTTSAAARRPSSTRWSRCSRSPASAG